MTAGLDVLYRLGAKVPVLALAGRPLADQARRLYVLLAHTSWTADLLLAALAAPFEGPVRTSAGAVVSARITALPAAPAVECAPEPDGARLSVAQEKDRRVMAECTKCGRPPEAGMDRCAECAGWPLCPSCAVPHPGRRLLPPLRRHGCRRSRAGRVLRRTRWRRVRSGAGGRSSRAAVRPVRGSGTPCPCGPGRAVDRGRPRGRCRGGCRHPFVASDLNVWKARSREFLGWTFHTFRGA